MAARATRTAVVLQPSYIPWRGYFDLIRRSDVFVFYDDVQYDKHGWRNRNRIKTPSGVKWLTIPVLSKGNVERNVRINEVRTDFRVDWRQKHLEQLRHAYRAAPFFDETFAFVRESYGNADTTLLATFTMNTTIAIARYLGLPTEFVRSSQLDANGSKTTRLIEVLQTVGATRYISGPAARAYIEEEPFAEHGISLQYISYEYEPYAQLYPPYELHVSILDLLFMKGREAAAFVRPVG